MVSYKWMTVIFVLLACANAYFGYFYTAYMLQVYIVRCKAYTLLFLLLKVYVNACCVILKREQIPTDGKQQRK